MILLTHQDGCNPPRHGTTSGLRQGLSPYCLPVINNFMTPVPPTTKKRDRASIRGRRLRSTNVPVVADVNEVIHL